jgi:predicted nucleic acid-binding protein
MIVVDTSVAIKWVVAEPSSGEALAFLELAESLIAPDLLLPEAAHVLRKKVRRSEVSADQVGPALSLISTAIDAFVPSSTLLQDATALSFELDHAAYDCFFLACAIRMGILVTADEVFARKCSDRGYGAAVVSLSADWQDQIDKRQVLAALDQQTIDELDRLSARLDTTVELLSQIELSDKDPFVFKPAYNLASSTLPYWKLERDVKKLGLHELQAMICLSWFSRPEHSSHHLMMLWNRAARFAAQGFEANAPYIMSLIRDVPAGAKKLRELLQTIERKT